MKRSSLFFRMGGYLFILFFVAHSFAHFSDPGTRLQDAESKRVWQLVHNYEFDVGGLVLNPGRLLAGYDWFLMIFTLFSGAQILLIARTGDRGLMKQTAALNMVMVGLLFIVTAVYFKIPPPLVLFALIWVMMLLSLITAEKSPAPG